MIWYRHYLELRYRLLAAASMALLIHLFLSSRMHDAMDPFDQLSIATSIFAALALGGSAFRDAIGNMDMYSATLPISRFDLDATRLAAGFAGVSAIAFSTCFIDIVVLLLTGHPVPWVPMLRASLTGAMLLLPLLAALSLAMISSWSAVLMMIAAPLFAVRGWPAIRSLILDPDLAAIAALLALPTTVVLFIAGLWLRRWKEL